MLPPDCDRRLLSEIQLTEARGSWQIQIRYGERRDTLGERSLYRDASRAWGPPVLEKAPGSPERRAMRQGTEAEHRSAQHHGAKQAQNG